MDELHGAYTFAGGDEGVVFGLFYFEMRQTLHSLSC